MDRASMRSEPGRRVLGTFGTRIGWPALVVSLTASVSCGDAGLSEECLPVGCGSPLTVEFVHDGDWPDGSYRIDADADGRQVSCVVTIPATSDDGASCDNEDSGCVVLTSGCAGGGTCGIRGLYCGPSLPAQVSLQVYRDGQPIAQGDFVLQYVPHDDCHGCQGSYAALPVP